MVTVRTVLAGLGVQCAGACCGQALTDVTHDSRDVIAGSLFVARRGETMDGHAFIADALRRGAAAVLAERVVDLPAGACIIDLRHPVHVAEATGSGVLYIVAEDSQAALESVASWWRAQLTVDVIGITGSLGKTSTKEATAAVLARSYAVLKSERSLNTDVGMALTLLKLTEQHQKAVLEMGMYARGEIAHLCRLARPRIGIVTNVGPIHLERLGSIDAIAEAKAELVDALPGDGVAILNADDERVWAMRSRVQGASFGFGLHRGADLWADDIVSRGLDGIAFTLHHGRRRAAVQTPLVGVHSVQNALAAAAAGIVCGMTLSEAAAGLALAGHTQRLVVRTAANGATILDDTWNASPASVLASLGVLAETAGRHVAVLGDMLELGAFEDEGHRQVGRRAAQVAALLVVVGGRARLIGEAAAAAGMAAGSIHAAANNVEAAALLRRLTQAGDTILIKGSRGMTMEDIVHALVAASA